MILVCTDCNARYLVPATHFMQGPRPVRCARCGHVWQAGLPIPEKQSPVKEKTDNPLQDAVSANQTSTASPSTSEGGFCFTEPPSVIPPIPQGSGIPVVWRNPIWRQLAEVGFIFLVAFLFVFMAGAAVERKLVAKNWPETERIFEFFGLPIIYPGDGLSFQNVTAERRADGEEARLFVAGDVRNDLSEVQNMPDIVASAIGAEGTTVLRWQIKAPTSQLEAGAKMPFESSIQAPDKPVAEIVLSFVGGRDHNEKTFSE